MWLQEDLDHDIIIVDSLTEMARVIMQGALSQPALGQGRPYAEIPILQDWSLTIERVRNIVRKIRELVYKDKWVIFTAASSTDRDQNTGKIMGGPELPGKQLSPEICYLMDEVYHMVAVNTAAGPKRGLQTTPDSIYMAKTRIPGLQSLIEMKPGDKEALNFLRRR
jgi:hypothetical protein